MSADVFSAARWTTGFSRNPIRFLASKNAWKAIGWTFAMALTGMPLLLCTLLMFPWAPLIARLVDQIARAGAQWMGVPVAPRKPQSWFDWRQFLLLLAFLWLSAASMIIMALFTPPMSLFMYVYPGNMLVSLLLITATSALLFLTISLYGSWTLTGLLVAITQWANNSSEEEVQRSRDVLIDAFTGERRRIERELHDGVQQYLTALQLNIATLELVNTDQGQQAQQAIEQAKSNAQRALEALRATTRGIYPQVLQDKGLVEALQELVAHSGINGSVHCDTPVQQISDTAALLLYHCAAEGITNAVRHGDATTVAVTLEFHRDAVVLSVDDDGSGISTQGDGVRGEGGQSGDGRGVDTRQRHSGTGIAGLQERAAALHGTVRLSGSWKLPGGCLSISLPVLKGQQ